MEKGMSLLLLLLLLALIPFLTSSSATVDHQSDGVGEWQILTKHNFSSQIRLHTHLLLFVTVPWSGEFRSLMKEVTQLVKYKHEQYRSLKLMFMYRNTERVLADAIGATEGEGMVTVLYYHYSLSFKYSGRLRALNILSSIHPYLSDPLPPHEMPIKTLNSEEDLKLFVDSTDKAVILLEFCGWTPELLYKHINNGTEETGFVIQGFGRETNRMPTPRGTDNQKGMEIENGKLQCDVENWSSGIPWFADFRTLNNSDQYKGSENIMPGVGLSCTTEEFRQFESFFSKFITIAREFFLPPQRNRFGLLSDRSLLPSLGVRDPGSWLTILYFNGCPSCSKILKDSEDLKGALQADSSIVMELEGDGRDLEPELPANKASIVLFVDRSSISSEARRRSKEALDVYRELALQHQMYQNSWQYYDQPSSGQGYQALKSMSRHPRLKLSPAAKKVRLKDKMSITIINDDGKPVSLDSINPELQGSNLREILEILLQKKKKTKLSSLANEVGFHLLSDDLDLRIADALPSQMEVQSDQVSSSPKEDPLINIPGKDQLSQETNELVVQHEEKSKVTSVEESSSNDDETKTIVADIRKQLISVDSDQHILDEEIDLAEGVEGQSSLQRDESSEQKLQYQGFKGYFFFCDGNYRLLRALTGRSRIPSLVIVDPASQQHYVFSENANFSYSSMADFLQEFLNGSLLPYERSEYVLQGHREAAHPPFVNLDFREVDSIPRISIRTFSELVIGFNRSSTDNAADAWNEDVLVLFSNTWCGFCQRMELVVREVYRAMKGYVKMIKSGTSNEQTLFPGDNSRSVTLQVPSIYLLDCTLNDCNLILKSINQREVYPALMLFPAGKKNAVSYNGDMSVTSVIKFIADYGSNSQHLIREKGILAEKGSRNQDLVKASRRNQDLVKASQTVSQGEAPLAEVFLKDRTAKTDVKYIHIKSPTLKTLHELASNVVVGSVLTATDKLLNANPFDKSQILIIKADHDTGFEGLIFNKHIKWDAFQELEEGLEFLKEAPLSFGGPVIKRGMPLVALTQRAIKDQYREVVPGVYFVDQLATIHVIEMLKSGNQSFVTDYWFFLGYSSWGWRQLFHEISEGAWNLSDGNKGHFEWPSKLTMRSEADPLIDS